MAEIREGLYSLNAGQVSRNVLAHIDIAKLKAACERQENFLPLVLGPAMMRPGTQYRWRLPTARPPDEFKKDDGSHCGWPTRALQVFDAIAEQFVARAASAPSSTATSPPTSARGPTRASLVRRVLGSRIGLRTG
jgi:hypothetical protein